MNTTETVTLTTDSNYIPVKYRIVEMVPAATAATTYCTLQVVDYGWDTEAHWRNYIGHAITSQNPRPTAPNASVNYYPGGYIYGFGGGTTAGIQGTLGVLSVAPLSTVIEYPIIIHKYFVNYNDNFSTTGTAPYDSSFYAGGDTVTVKGNLGTGGAAYSRTDISFVGLETLTRADISFSATDNSINTVGGSFTAAGFANGQTGLTVSGSLYNNFNAFAGASIVTTTATKLIITGYTITTEAATAQVTVTSGNQIVTAAGNFLTAGFGPGQTGLKITGSGSNNITSGTIVTATTLVLTLDPSTVLVDEIAGATDVLSTPLVAPGYTFGGWSTSTDWKRGTLGAEPTGGKIYAPSATFAMPPQDLILWAVWNPIYTLTVLASASTWGSVTPNTPTVVTFNSPQAITATANVGYQFVNWTVVRTPAMTNDTQFSTGVIFANQTSATTTVTLTDYALTNVTIQANFTKT
jgi:hypothetical protein